MHALIALQLLKHRTHSAHWIRLKPVKPTSLSVMHIMWTSCPQHQFRSAGRDTAMLLSEKDTARDLCQWQDNELDSFLPAHIMFLWSASSLSYMLNALPVPYHTYPIWGWLMTEVCFVKTFYIKEKGRERRELRFGQFWLRRQKLSLLAYIVGWHFSQMPDGTQTLSLNPPQSYENT